MPCKHPRMQSTARTDRCPDCNYEYYYGDAHAVGEAQISKLVCAGNDPESEQEIDPPIYLRYYCSICRSEDCDGYCDCPD